jgi:release factor glutamine methyltransferase
VNIRPIIEGRFFLYPSFRAFPPDAFVLKIKELGFMFQRVVFVQPSNRPTVNLALSTLVERALQIRPFLCKTKPIFTEKKSTYVFATKKIMRIKPIGNPVKNKPNQTQPVVSLPALSAVEGSNLFRTWFNLSKSFLFFTFLSPRYNLAMQTWTIQKLLNWTTEYFTEKGIDSPRLSAELLLSHVLEMQRIELYTQFDKPVAKDQLNILHDLVKRAGQHEPIAYLTGRTEFYSLRLEVCPDCMIPRPETELLVERAIEFLRDRAGPQFFCDLCTGCGCIAVAIAKNYPGAKIIATDICDAALNVAAKNIEKYNLQDRITLLSGDLFEPLLPHLDVDKFDLIVCNPPYVSAAEYEKLEKNVKDYEPKLALFAGEDGLDVYRRIIKEAGRFLKSDAALMLEIGYTQGKAVKELLEKSGAFAEVKIEKDFHDNDRIVTAFRKSL